MKKINFFPFERNRYYYGKHLTVNDFVLEQDYMNNKRRFINRYLHGTGVICGLDVVAMDKKNISVEAGAAIDFAGREIVIESPVTKNLSSIDGFDENDDADKLYLCLDYNEKETQPVYSITGVSSSSQGLECNSCTENYSLRLTSRKPDSDINPLDSFYISDNIIYRDSDFTVRQRTMLFAESGSRLELKVIVEKTNSSASEIFFKYNAALTCLKYNDSDILSVEFDERKFRKAKKYIVSYTLDAANITDDYAVIENSGQITVSKDNEAYEHYDLTFSIKPKIVSSSVEENIRNEYYSRAMEKTLKYSSYQYSIYLAEIDLIRARNTYLIENIENMPFNQYIFSGQLAGIMNSLILEKFKSVSSPSAERADSQDFSVSDITDNRSYMISSGETVIDLGIGGKFGQVFTSEKIAHGLGLGAVDISLGCACNEADSKQIIYGSSEVFNDALVKCETAAKLDSETGNFVIGIRLLENTTKNKVKIFWTAVRKKENEDEMHNRRIFIQPSIADLSVMQTCYFTAVFENINDKRVIWSVKEANGGTINSNGMYTAPNTPGIYEISAQSEAYPEVRTSIYAIVNDIK